MNTAAQFAKHRGPRAHILQNAPQIHRIAELEDQPIDTVAKVASCGAMYKFRSSTDMAGAGGLLLGFLAGQWVAQSVTRI